MSWLLLAAAIAAEVTATLSIRASDGFRRPGFVVLVVGGYLSAFALLAVVLDRGVPLGVAYGTWAACGVALTAVAGHVLFGDPLNRRMVLGIGTIIVGVLGIELGSHAH